MMAHLKDWLYIFSAALALGAVVYSFISSKSSANRKAIARLNTDAQQASKQITKIESSISEIPEIRKGIKKHGERIVKIESLIGELPEMRKEVAVVHRRIDDVAQTTSNISGQMHQVNRTLTLIEQHLIGNTPS